MEVVEEKTAGTWEGGKAEEVMGEEMVEAVRAVMPAAVETAEVMEEEMMVEARVVVPGVVKEVAMVVEMVEEAKGGKKEGMAARMAADGGGKSTELAR